MMIDGMFRKSNMLQKALDASALRNDIISNNIANVDTTNFKRKDVEFESLLRKKISENGNASSTEGTDDITPKVYTDNKTLSTRIDGNNVDIDTESAELAKNNIKYATLTNLISRDFKSWRDVLK